MRNIHFLAVALFLVAAVPLSAQSSVELVAEQTDTVAGVGDISTFDACDVNNDGNLRLWVDTGATTSVDEAIVDSALAVLLQEGQAMTAPAGSTLGGFDSVNLNNAGDSFWFLRLDGTTGSTDDAGLYFGDTLVIQEGAVSAFSGTYKDFRELKFNDQNQALAVVTLAQTPDRRAIVRIEVDGSGNLVSETLVAIAGTPLPGMPQVSDFHQNPEQLAFNNAGQAMFIAAGGSINSLYLDNTQLIQQNTPSPVPGRDYSSSTSFGFDMNDHGDWVARVGLNGSPDGNQALLKNGNLLIQKGDTHPDIAPFVITSLGAGPVHIDNAGRVLWYAAWDDHSSRNEGWFLDDKLVIQEDVTMVNGEPIYSVGNFDRKSSLSDDCGYFLFIGRVQTSTRNATFLAKFFTLLPPDPGVALVVNDFTVKHATPNEKVYFAYSLQTGNLNLPGCPGLKIGLTAPEVFGTKVADANGDATFSTFVPNKASGRTVYLQAAQLNSCQLSNRVAYTYP